VTWRRLAVLAVIACGCSHGTARVDDAVTGGSANQAGVAGARAGSGGASVTGGAGGTAGVSASGGAAATSGESTSGADFHPLANDTASGVFVHLFEWRWPDIARECESYLGPHGFTAVQVSPPSEHAVLAANQYPWWQRYQTVSYQLESRSGTRQEFVDMVARCRNAGVGVYVDAVLNHTTGQTQGVGSAGTRFTKYDYPGLYQLADFHAPVCQIQGEDYATSAERVQRCELLGLSDLDTGQAAVQEKLAAYLSELLALGVRGFRIDAAKHVAPADLAAILAKVVPAHGEQPYYFLEVIDYGGEAVHSTDYVDVGGAAELDITEFRYHSVADAFLGRSGATLASLRQVAEATTLLPSERAVVFLDNHDTQRGDALFYQDGAAHELATVFELAFPYGYPSLMSSFAFDRATDAGRAAGPPSDGKGTTLPIYASASDTPSCAAPPFDAATRGWVCEHRTRSAAAMVAFRKAAAGAPLENFWDNGANQIAFSRGDRGFVAINHEPTDLAQSLPTGLGPGQYCDVLSGDYVAPAGAPATCTGRIVTVDDDGNASITVAPETALALSAEAKL
jgi:alpha-amylase